MGFVPFPTWLHDPSLLHARTPSTEISSFLIASLRLQTHTLTGFRQCCDTHIDTNTSHIPHFHLLRMQGPLQEWKQMSQMSLMQPSKTSVSSSVKWELATASLAGQLQMLRRRGKESEAMVCCIIKHTSLPLFSVPGRQSPGCDTPHWSICQGPASGEGFLRKG